MQWFPKNHFSNFNFITESLFNTSSSRMIARNSSILTFSMEKRKERRGWVRNVDIQIKNTEKETSKTMQAKFFFTKFYFFNIFLKAHSLVWDNFGQTKSPLKMMKICFNFTLKALLILEILKILSWLLGQVKKTALSQRSS